MKTKLFIMMILFVTVGILSAQNVISVNPGTDQVSAAMATATAGDILELSEGVFTETNTLNTINGDLTIRGADGAEAIIYGPTVVGGNLIHVYGNLWLENLILVGSDSSRIGIVNYHGGVETSGGEFTAEKNNLYINNCMFLVFVKEHIGQHAGSTWGEDPWEYPLDDNKWHPYDTLRVTDCLFYGADITNNKGIFVGQRQARYIEIRRSTMWSFGTDAFEVHGAYVGDDVDNPGPGSDLLYTTTIADHLTIFNTFNNCPAQGIGRGGDGIHYEWSNRNQSMTNTIVFRSGRFCYKGKRGEPTLTIASNCMGDSANVSGDYSPPTVFYWTMTKGPGCREDNPYFTDHWNGDFSLNPLLSDAIGGADDGSNLGDPHWDKPATHWPKKAELEAIIAKANPSGSGIGDFSPNIVENFTLDQNYPNPFNPRTEISYSIESAGNVILEIYSPTGQHLRTLVNEVMNAGSHCVVWDGLDERGYSVPTGVYFYRLVYGSDIATRKMLLIK
jgi:hypothetical protein